MTSNCNRRRTYGGLAPGEADFTISLSRATSDPSQIVSIDGYGMDDFLKKFRRCLMKSTSDHHANICYLDDSNSNYYYDGSNAILTRTEGDVMVYFPEFWYKCETSTDNHKIHISTSQINGYYHSPASLVGAYKAYNEGISALRSLSKVNRTTSLTIDQFYKYARVRGKGFHLIDYMQHRTIAWMFYTRYKNTDSQSICGTGDSSSTGILNGTTNGLGITDTTTLSAANDSNRLVNFLGIEGCWGYTYEFIEGIHSNSNDNAVIAYDKPDLVNDSLDNYEYNNEYSYLQSNFTLPTLRKLNDGYLYGYIKDIWGGDYGDMTIAEKNNSSSYPEEHQYYCDYGYVYPSGTHIFSRSYSSAYSNGGVSFLNGSWNSNNSYSSVGSRLAFDGTIVETSVADFKAISNWR